MRTHRELAQAESQSATDARGFDSERTARAQAELRAADAGRRRGRRRTLCPSWRW